MIFQAKEKDVDTVVDMAIILWEHHQREELKDELLGLLNNADCAIYIAQENNKPIGFAQVQLRHDYVEGTDSSPVGYLEGIFVKEEYRKQEYATKLLQSCEEWARERNCIEFASDCELPNVDSLAFHLAVGFSEANRIICFTKKL